MQDFRKAFYRLEAFLFQKPWLFGAGCFVACWIVSFIPMFHVLPVDPEWQKASFVLGPANGLYAWFWKWRHRNDP